MSPNDIFLWPDNFWCFREEHCEKFLRGTDYRVIEHKSREWETLYAGHPPLVLSLSVAA